MQQELNINIPHYPPFKLRSSLIDKDPVIWVHLLESYIKLFKFLNSKEEDAIRTLSIKSQKQLQLFLKVFLFEVSREDTQVFSLGAINPDIRRNSTTLKAYVFQFIKNFSLIKLGLAGDSIWNFVLIYVSGNITTVRGLVDGSMKSKYNDNKKSGNISSIGLVHKHLNETIINGKFTKQDLEALSALLGQHASFSGRSQTINVTGGGPNTKNRTVNKKNSSALPFAESFVNSAWIELLEKIHADGEGLYANTSKDVLITSLISLSVARIAKLAMDLGITNVDAFIICPLFSSLIISEPFKELFPGLEERLPFLRTITFGAVAQENSSGKKDNGEPPVSEEHITFLMELFPLLTHGKSKVILQENNDDLDHVTNLLLENPDLIDSIQEEEFEEDYDVDDTSSALLNQSLVDRFAEFDIANAEILDKKNSDESTNQPEDLKKKTLSAALRLMYESDEDEPDDSYIYNESEATSKDYDGNNEEEKEEQRTRQTVRAVVPSQERYLFAEYKTKGPSAFTKQQRGTPVRLQFKKTTSWTDEQIEGWFRMMSKVPRRFKILEEDFLMGGNPNRPQKQTNSDSDDVRSTSGSPVPSSGSSSAPQSKEQEKRKNARNEKNKARTGNHNRKAKSTKKTGLQANGLAN
ncbi:RQC trigger complex subunit Cue3p [[Candida] anglica]|uniref:RQC trigger complex subunit Cue3p n=1 Tax=[Candida] anglica TaxID=148631 RepID=A0ABP0EK27_9ASCO